MDALDGAVADCAAACSQCAERCSGCGEGAGLLCAEVCAATARVLARDFDTEVVRPLLDACAAACRACAEACTNDAECAQACRRCEEACVALLTALPT